MDRGATAGRTRRFSAARQELLLELLEAPTVTPMETGAPSAIADAQRLVASAAASSGFEVELHEPPPREVLLDPRVPPPVRALAAELGEEFLSTQPNMVLRLGPLREPRSTVMFNAHIDTVGGSLRVDFDGERFHGRGAVDMKGPLVAVLAGIEAAIEERPDLPGRVTVLLQCPAGEEGGAMGSYGTRVLCEAGYTGRLNVFAEPTDGRFWDSCPATMTARVTVDGDGATDDAPWAGHNATVLLGHVATELAATLDGPVAAAGGRMCVAGIDTGRTHDRVYGAGALLVNLAYPSVAAARAIEHAFDATFDDALTRFGTRFRDVEAMRLTARDARAICSLEWLKRGLPALSNRDADLERLLTERGVPRAADGASATCDAIWGATVEGYSIVWGPGSLDRDGAHTDRESVALSDLESYAGAVCDVLLAFDDAYGVEA